MSITLLGTSLVSPIGFQDVTPTNGTLTIPAPAELTVGSYYIVVTHFQGLRGDNIRDQVPEGFIRLFATESAEDRAVSVWAKNIETSAHLAEVQNVPIRAGASSTRVAAVGIALSGVYALDPLLNVSPIRSESIPISNITMPNTTGSYVLGIVASNTPGYTGGTIITPNGGAMIRVARAWATSNVASASSTNLALVTGATSSVSFDAQVTQLTLLELGLMAAADVDPLGPDPVITNRTDIAPSVDRPVVETGTMTTGAAPTIPGSAGWLREKRVGIAENIPGGSQSSTADLDLTGSTRFSYPSVPLGQAHPANPGNYVRTLSKPGGAPQAANWLFNLSFVVRGTNVVQLRLRSGVVDPSIGRIYVNGRPISDQATVATGIAAGVGYYATLTFPTVATRIITIYALNGTTGSFGGVAVGPGGTVAKPTAPVTRRIAVIGDSFTNGSGSYPTGASPVETFAWRVAWGLGAQEVIQAGIGGTGWEQTVGGLPESTFAGRVADVLALNPHVIIFAGGRNDSPPIQDLVTSTITAATATGVTEFYVIPTATDGQLAVRDEMRAGTDAAGVTSPSGDSYIDVAQSGAEIGADGIHLTAAGHLEFANRILDFIANRIELMEAPTLGAASFRVMEPQDDNPLDPEYRGIGDVQSAWSVRDSTTPHSLANDTGSSGTVSFSAPVRDDETDLLWNSPIKTIATFGDRQITTCGRITEVTTDLEFLSIDHDDIRSRLNVEVRTEPFEVPRRLSDMFEYYIGLAVPTAPIEFKGIGGPNDPIVSYPHWEGNCWEKLKELCSITRKRLHPNKAGDGFIITDLLPGDEPIKTVDQFVEGLPEISPQNPELVQQFQITNLKSRTVTWAAKEVVYSAELDRASHSVGILENKTIFLDVPHSLTRVTTEIPILNVSRLAEGQEGYIVTDSEGLLVSPSLWTQAGGRLTASVSPDDPSLIQLTLSGPRTTLAERTAPFTLQTPGEAARPQLNIKGAGIFVAPKPIRIYTGVNPETVIIRTGPNYESPFLVDADHTYRAAAAAAFDLSGPKAQLRFTVGPDSDLSVGERIYYRWCNWRIIDMTFSSTGATVTAVPYTKVSEKDAVWANRTVAQYDAFWTGRRVYDSKLRPLWTD